MKRLAILPFGDQLRRNPVIKTDPDRYLTCRQVDFNAVGNGFVLTFQTETLDNLGDVWISRDDLKTFIDRAIEKLDESHWGRNPHG
jgi:hypothetical protein